jgi:hypothetical protein
MVRIQSFVVGMAIAGVLFGFALVIYNAFAGGDGYDNDFLVVLPTRIPTAVSAAPTQPPQSSAAPASLTPNISSILSFTAVPAATTVPGALGDRTSCDQIRGTAYRSEAERIWFTANCQASPTPTPAGSAASVTSTPEPPAVTPPTPSGPDPIVGAYAALIREYDGAADTLADAVDVPFVADAEWRGSVIAAAQRLQSLGSIAATVTVPGCLGQAQVILGTAISQLHLAANLALAAVNDQDAGAFSVVEQRIGAGRSSLTQATQAVNAAPC